MATLKKHNSNNFNFTHTPIQSGKWWEIQYNRNLIGGDDDENWSKSILVDDNIDKLVMEKIVFTKTFEEQLSKVLQFDKSFEDTRVWKLKTVTNNLK